MKKKELESPKMEETNFSITGSLFKQLDRINESMDNIAGKDKKVKK